MIWGEKHWNILNITQLHYVERRKQETLIARDGYLYNAPVKWRDAGCSWNRQFKFDSEGNQRSQ